MAQPERGFSHLRCQTNLRRVTLRASRRRFQILSLLVVGATAAAACGGSSAGSTGSRTTSVGSVTSAIYPSLTISWLPQIAAEQGFFKAEGLSVKLLPVSNGPQAVSAIVSGSADTMICAIDLCGPVIEKGTNLQQVVGGIASYFVLVARPGLKVPSDFKGMMQALHAQHAKVGVLALGTVSQYLFKAFAQGAGLNPADFQYVPGGGNAQAAAALQSGAVDVAVIQEPAVSQLVGAGKGKILIDLRQQATQQQLASDPVLATLPTRPYGGTWATQKWIATHAAAAKAYRNGIVRADCWLHDPANLAAMTDLVFTKLGGPAAITSPQAREEYVRANLGVPESYFSADDGRADLAFAVKYKALKGPLPLDTLIANLDGAGPHSKADVATIASKIGASCSAYK